MQIMRQLELQVSPEEPSAAHDEPLLVAGHKDDATDLPTRGTGDEECLPPARGLVNMLDATLGPASTVQQQQQQQEELKLDSAAADETVAAGPAHGSSAAIEPPAGSRQATKDPPVLFPLLSKPVNCPDTSDSATDTVWTAAQRELTQPLELQSAVGASEATAAAQLRARSDYSGMHNSDTLIAIISAAVTAATTAASGSLQAAMHGYSRQGAPAQPEHAWVRQPGYASDAPHPAPLPHVIRSRLAAHTSAARPEHERLSQSEPHVVLLNEPVVSGPVRHVLAAVPSFRELPDSDDTPTKDHRDRWMDGQDSDGTRFHTSPAARMMVDTQVQTLPTSQSKTIEASKDAAPNERAQPATLLSGRQGPRVPLPHSLRQTMIGRSAAPAVVSSQHDGHQHIMASNAPMQPQVVVNLPSALQSPEQAASAHPANGAMSAPLTPPAKAAVLASFPTDTQRAALPSLLSQSILHTLETLADPQQAARKPHLCPTSVQVRNAA
eukprot:364261-Chlamydomonas_euryale.AAC.5